LNKREGNHGGLNGYRTGKKDQIKKNAQQNERTDSSGSKRGDEKFQTGENVRLQKQ